MSNKHLLQNFKVSDETKELALRLLHLANLNTGQGSGRAVGELSGGIPAACVLLAIDRLNTGELNYETAQKISCLNARNFKKVYQLTKAAVEQAEKSTCITYQELYKKYKREALVEFMSPWITQTEEELSALGHDDNQLRRCAVFFWAWNVIKPRETPDTFVFANAHDLSSKSFVHLLDVLNSQQSALKKSMQAAYKTQLRSPRKNATTSQAPGTPSKMPLASARASTSARKDVLEQEQEPPRRSGRFNSAVDPLEVATPPSSPRKRVAVPSPGKVAQPLVRFSPRKNAPLRELPSKDTPKKRPVEATEIDDAATPPQTPKRRKMDPMNPIFSLPFVQLPITPSRSVTFSPSKKKATIPLFSLPEPSHSSPPKVPEIIDDPSTPSEDESELDEPVVRRRFRPVYLEHRQWFARDPRIERMLKAAHKPSHS